MPFGLGVELWPNDKQAIRRDAEALPRFSALAAGGAASNE
jgi:hypothetical protein